MNGKHKLMAAAFLGAVIAFSIIAGSNLLQVVIPGFLEPSSISSAPGTGTLILNIKDAPPQTRNLTKLLIALAPGSVILHRAAENGTDNRITFDMYDNATNQFDLLALVGDVQQEIGSDNVLTGTYTMIEIHIANATGIFADNSDPVPLRVVADGKLKIPVVFRVVEGQTTEVTIDITLESTSINPNDVLRPVIMPIVEREPEMEEASEAESTSTTSESSTSSTSTTESSSG